MLCAKRGFSTRSFLLKTCWLRPSSNLWHRRCFRWAVHLFGKGLSLCQQKGRRFTSTTEQVALVGRASTLMLLNSAGFKSAPASFDHSVVLNSFLMNAGTCLQGCCTCRISPSAIEGVRLTAKIFFLFVMTSFAQNLWISSCS